MRALRASTRESGPSPEYATPMLGQTEAVLLTEEPSTSTDGSFFSDASTTPLLALIPRDVAPACTAASACSICTSFPLGLNVVSEKDAACVTTHEPSSSSQTPLVSPVYPQCAPSPPWRSWQPEHELKCNNPIDTHARTLCVNALPTHPPSLAGFALDFPQQLQPERTQSFTT